MRFHYSFQKIVDLKSSEKAQAEWGLSHAVGRLQAEEGTLSALHTEQEQLQQEVQSTSTVRMTASELMQYQQYINHLNHQIHKKQAEVKQAQQLVETHKEELTGKMKEEKIWLKARDRAFDSFRYNENKQEQLQLDELATIRHKSLG